MNNSLIIESRQLTKVFGTQIVVDHIDLSVPIGGCFGLLGPNGAGKTTTLRMCLGQTPFSSGELRVLGKTMPGLARAARAEIGVVPQADNLDPDLTVVENLMVYASYFGLKFDKGAARIKELLDLVELSDRADTKIMTLSGGMKRRLSIARALINDPKLLVLDEPTTGLDPQVRHLIWNRLRSLKKLGKTLLLTTHYMEEAERLCEDLVVIDAGRIVSQGPPKKLIDDHIASDVIEVHGNAPAIETLLSKIDDCSLRTVGETVYCYTQAPTAVIDLLHAVPQHSYLHRPANLEDVFLKLTGHELRE